MTLRYIMYSLWIYRGYTFVIAYVRAVTPT